MPGRCGVMAEKKEDALRLVGVLRDLGVTPNAAGVGEKAVIQMRRGKVENPYGFRGAYRLVVTADRIDVTAADREGFVWAAETLRQLVVMDAGKPVVGCVTIDDWPAFPVRGFMLDTGRNYQTPALIKEQIEVMCRYKLNVFHFHFTDNPGWRLESRKYPEVTSAKSMMRQAGRYYTQAEFRDLVSYCRERGITLIPEMDMPGHTEALRKAMGIKSMNDAATRAMLKDLLTELASLGSVEDMPYLHIGTDEVRGAAEKVDATFLPEMAAHVRSLGRELIGWRSGIEDPTDKRRITQLWARAKPLPENPFIDSRSTYLNHIDPFEAVSTFLFQQSCRRPHGDRQALGSVLCSWPDIRIERERDQLRQNPVYPAMVTFGESLWRGVASDDKEAYWANLPPPGTAEFERFYEFELRVLDHKRRFFKSLDFPYVAQGDLRWRIIGPFPHGGEMGRVFPVESGLQESYQIDGKSYHWMGRSFGGATVYLKHFFGFGAPVKEAEGTCYAMTHIWSPKDQEMPVWLGFFTSSRSDRRGAEGFKQGVWHPEHAGARVNGGWIAPPEWQNALPKVKDAETPFTNEDYFTRPPVMIHFKKGWNEVLLKIPHRKSDWKWMFTFVPVGDTTGIKYSDELVPDGGGK